MFELVQAYELAKNEKSKILKPFVVSYTRYKLRKVFFEKFDYQKIFMTKELLKEFFMIYKAINKDDKVYLSNESVMSRYPHIIYANDTSNTIRFEYHRYVISIVINENGYNIYVSDKNDKEISYHNLDEDTFKLTTFNQLLAMVVYNYCVLYVYGFVSDLYIDNPNYIKVIEAMY